METVTMKSAIVKFILGNSSSICNKANGFSAIGELAVRRGSRDKISKQSRFRSSRVIRGGTEETLIYYNDDVIEALCATSNGKSRKQYASSDIDPKSKFL